MTRWLLSWMGASMSALALSAFAHTDDHARAKVDYSKAQEMAFGDVAIIPLHIQKNIWATRAGYSFVPTVGETLHLVDVKQGK